MKKIILLIILIILTGCGSKHVTCTIDVDNNVMNYNFSAEYKIYYNDKFVNKIEKKETYTTSNKNTYDYLKQSKELEYDNLANVYGGYDYKITTKKNEIVIKTTIDTSKLDVEKLVKNGLISKYYTYKDKIYLTGLKKYYESKSAICK